MVAQTSAKGFNGLEPVVMVLDDNLPVFELYRTVLCSEGYEVRFLPVVPDRLDWEEHAPFDVLITELIVDGRETLSLIKEVKNRYPHTHVIVATRYDISEDIYPTLFEQGVDDVLSKPFSIQILISNLNKAVGGNGPLHSRLLH